MPYKNKISGIYKIENLINHKIYIGQSKDILNRLAQHKSDLRVNKHRNNYLQHSFLKYGEENFIFEILEKCNIDLLNEREIFFITNYKSNSRNFGYNIEAGGSNNQIVSKETRELLSKINKEKGLKNGDKNNFAKYTNNQIALVKKLLFLAMDFNEIIQITKVNRKTIFKILNMTNWTSILPELNEEISKINSKPNGTNYKAIIMFDKKFNIVEKFETGRDAYLKYGFSTSTISACCNHKIVLAHDYIWLFDDENLLINIEKKKQKIKENNVYILQRIDSDGNILETLNSISEASKKYNLDISAISKVCDGIIKQTKGYKFKKEYIA